MADAKAYKRTTIFQEKYSNLNYDELRASNNSIQEIVDSLISNPLPAEAVTIGPANEVIAIDGSVTTPAIRWENDTSSGRYRIGNDNFGEAVNGVLAYDWNATRLLLALQLQLQSGTAAAPGLAFGSDAGNNSGFYYIGADNIGASAGGTLYWDWNTTRILYATNYELQFRNTSMRIFSSAARNLTITVGPTGAARELVLDPGGESNSYVVSNGHILPDGTSFDLGDATDRWDELYVTTVRANGTLFWKSSGSGDASLVHSNNVSGTTYAFPFTAARCQMLGLESTTQPILGDTFYGQAFNTGEGVCNPILRLAGNTSTTKNFLTQTGTGSVSAAPAWGTIEEDDLPNNLTYTRYTSTANGQVTNTATEGTLIGSGSGSLSITANTAEVGKTYTVKASGYYSTQVVPVTLNIRIKLGSTTILATGDQTPGGAIANLHWTLEGRITVRTTGATGTVHAQSGWDHQATATGAPLRWQMVNTATVTVDTTATASFDLTADWGAGVAAADDIVCTNFELMESE